MLPHLGSACQHYDRRGCGGGGTVPDPPKKPPEPPPPAPLYYVMESSGLCVSDEEVPKPKWIQATFETYRRCCNKAWDKNQCLKDRPCTDDDPCEEEQPPPSPAAPSACPWHLDLKAQNGCSNSDNVSEMRDDMSSAVAPASPPAPSLMCLSLRQYPDDWNKPAFRDEYLFPTADLCCATMLPQLGSACQHRDNGCGGANLLPAPGPPPPAPLYYVMESSGLCVSDEEVPKPEWIQATFETYRQCCNKAWDKNQCLKDRPCTDDDPCEEAAPLSPITTPYYVDETPGMCVSEAEKPRPTWVDKTYADYGACCRELPGNMRETCAKARPLEEGETAPPTPAPPTRFYYHDATSGECVSDAEKAPVSAPRFLPRIALVPRCSLLHVDFLW